MPHTCPLCDAGFEDWPAFAAHLDEVHDLRDDQGTTPGSEPAPGPQVPTQARWAPPDAGALPPPPLPPTPLPAPPAQGGWYIPPPPPEPAERRGAEAGAEYAGPGSGGPDAGIGRLLVIAVGGVALVVAILVLGLSLIGHSPKEAASVGPSSETTAPDTSAADIAALTAHVLQPEDLAKAYSRPETAKVLGNDAIRNGCRSRIADRLVGGAAASYFYELQANGTVHGSITSAAYLTKSGKAVASVQAEVASYDYTQCLENDAFRRIQEASQIGVTDVLIESTSKPYGFPLPLPGSGLIVTTRYTADGNPVTATEVRIFLFAGSSMGTVTVEWCTCSPFPADSIPAVLASAAVRLERGGTV